ncbi:MAG: DNA polymerase III subunit delta' [Alphaproteobacteria bacterium]
MTENTENILPPKEQTDLLGHDEALAHFWDVFNTGRAHHAWLVTGTKGIGKASFVYKIIREILAETHVVQELATAESSTGGLFGDALPMTAPATETLEEDVYTGEGLAPDHPVFKQVASGVHPDLFVMESELEMGAGSQIKVDEVRKLSSFTTMTSANNGWRIALVDPVDQLNRNAANALLKILEEPPKKTLIFLVCHAPGKLLPTIRSRCRVLKMKTLPEDVIEELIEENFKLVSSGDQRMLTRYAEGSFGRAVNFYDNDGLTIYKSFLNLMETFPKFNTADLYKFCEKSAKEADGFVTTVNMLFWWMGKNMTAVHTGDGAEEFSQYFKEENLPEWLALWDKMQELLGQTKVFHLDRKQVLLSLFSTMKKIGQ